MPKAELKGGVETIKARLKLVAGFHSRPAAIEMGRALSDFIDRQEDKTVAFTMGFWLLEQIKPSPAQSVNLMDAIYFYHILSIYYPRFYQSVSFLCAGILLPNISCCHWPRTT